MKKRNSEKEIYDFLYGVMRGDIKDCIATKEKNEFGEYIYQEAPASIAVRMKAAELLFKSVSQTESGEDILPVVICEDL